MGYSDAGTLLAALYARGIGRQFHGPMPVDIVREGGEAAVVRALRWLVDQDDESLEASVRATDKPVAAFNLPILSHLMGTPWLPDLSGHVLLLEVGGEYVSRIDRALAQVTSRPAVRVSSGNRPCPFSNHTPNEPRFRP